MLFIMVSKREKQGDAQEGRSRPAVTFGGEGGFLDQAHPSRSATGLLRASTKAWQTGGGARPLRRLPCAGRKVLPGNNYDDQLFRIPEGNSPHSVGSRANARQETANQRCVAQTPPSAQQNRGEKRRRRQRSHGAVRTRCPGSWFLPLILLSASGLSVVSYREQITLALTPLRGHGRGLRLFALELAPCRVQFSANLRHPFR